MSIFLLVNKLAWRSRKEGPQKGQHFLSRRVTGDPRADLAKERYLRSLVRGSKTTDLNVAINKLSREGQALAVELKKKSTRFQKDRKKFHNQLLKVDARIKEIKNKPKTQEQKNHNNYFLKIF